MIWRIVQGAGGAALLSTAQATIRQIFPREQQGLVQAVFLLGIIVAPTLGPTLGGWITDNYTWNWCFFINVPIAIAVDLPGDHLPQGSAGPDAAHRRGGLAGHRPAHGRPGRRCSTCWRRGTQDDWFNDALILRLAIVAGVCLVTHGVVGAVAAEPASGRQLPGAQEPRAGGVDLPVRRRSASGSTAACSSFPCSPRRILHFTPTETGLALLPGGIATAVDARSSAAGCSTAPGRWWIRAS